jgi:hypothetical protein
VSDIYQVYLAGVGKHAYDLTWPQLSIAYKLVFVHILIYIWAQNFIKNSILCFYMRMLNESNIKMVRFLRCMQAVLMCISCSATVLVFFLFRPARAMWDLEARLGHFEESLPIVPLFTAMTILWGVYDVVVLVTPMHMVWKLHVTLQKRIALIGLFSFGGIACVACIIRATLIKDVWGTWDSTWMSLPMMLCTQIECTIGTICASLPVLSAPTIVLWQRLFPPSIPKYNPSPWYRYKPWGENTSFSPTFTGKQTDRRASVQRSRKAFLSTVEEHPSLPVMVDTFIHQREERRSSEARRLNEGRSDADQESMASQDSLDLVIQLPNPNMSIWKKMSITIESEKIETLSQSGTSGSHS